MVGGRGSEEAPKIGLSRRLAEHDRVVVDKGQVLALLLGESVGHTERRASQQLWCGDAMLPQGWPEIYRRGGAFDPEETSTIGSPLCAPLCLEP